MAENFAASPTRAVNNRRAVPSNRQTKVSASVIFFVFAFYSHHKHPKYLGREFNHGHCLSQNLFHGHCLIQNLFHGHCLSQNLFHGHCLIQNLFHGHCLSQNFFHEHCPSHNFFMDVASVIMFSWTLPQS